MDVVGVGQDLTGEEVFLCRGGVAGDENGGSWLGKQQAARSGCIAEEREEIDGFVELIVGALEFVLCNGALLRVDGPASNAPLPAGRE